jgi:hypothetical protein
VAELFGKVGTDRGENKGGENRPDRREEGVYPGTEKKEFAQGGKTGNFPVELPVPQPFGEDQENSAEIGNQGIS